jgi:hypothetical protein
MVKFENPFSRFPPVDESTFVCKIGDHLAVCIATKTEESELVEVGSLYEVVDRTAYAWHLKLIQGSGANVLRVMNSNVLSYFSLVDSSAPNPTFQRTAMRPRN